MAHICSYSPSAAMIAAALSPKKFDRTNCTIALRLAATASGWTIAARAVSKAPATARAPPAACWAWAAAALKNPT